jgi:hypothetical protein
LNDIELCLRGSWPCSICLPSLLSQDG